MSSFGDYQTPERMKKKLAAVPLPDLRGKSVLDVGCDHGAWCALALERGATRVVGIDRGRDVRGEGFVDLALRNRSEIVEAEFRKLELGRQWDLLGLFDVVLMLNLYHHVFNVCEDHEAIWFWLSKHVVGELLWENPTSTVDGVARKDIRPSLHAAYNERAIREAAERYFDIEVVGQGWTSSRVVWRCRPKLSTVHSFATVKSGAGGASKAFAYAEERRAKEIDIALGFYPVNGSLNLQADEAFHWDRRYFRAQILDVKDRKKGLASEWHERWCRFYPVFVEDDGHRYAYAMRFENEHYASGKPYPETLIELISAVHLRTALNLHNGEEVCLCS